MNHPLSAITTTEELREISRKVQYCEITWPQCYEKGDPIYMTTINTLGDLIKHIRLDDKPPTRVEVVEVAKLTEWLRLCWNAAKSVGCKEAYDAIKQQTLRAEIDAQAAEAEAFHIRCRKTLKAKQRAERK